MLVEEYEGYECGGGVTGSPAKTLPVRASASLNTRRKLREARPKQTAH